MPTIINFGRTPTVIGYGQKAYFGGPHLEDVLVGDSEVTQTAPKTLVIEDFGQGLRAKFQGSFTYSESGITDYTVKKITFFYQGEKFQVWKGLGWTDDMLEPVIDAYDNGDSTAIADFLVADTFRFLLHPQAVDPGYQTLTENDDRYIAKASDTELPNGITLFSYGGDDFIDLRTRTEQTDVNTGSGNDKVLFGDGISAARTGSGRDTIRGGDGADNIDGQGGRDKVFGGGGDDVYLTGGRGNDRVSGGDGDDYVKDTKGKNRLFGDEGDDYVMGRGWLSGGAGDDTLVSSSRRTTDTFDFRLRGDESYGRDKVTGTFSDAFGDSDRLVFDAGTVVDYSVNQDNMNLILRTSLDGEDTGVVVISGGGFYTDDILGSIDYL
jgi:Ca2+-binding RTX toxin-like protein